MIFLLHLRIYHLLHILHCQSLSYFRLKSTWITHIILISSYCIFYIVPDIKLNFLTNFQYSHVKPISSSKYSPFRYPIFIFSHITISFLFVLRIKKEPFLGLIPFIYRCYLIIKLFSSSIPLLKFLSSFPFFHNKYIIRIKTIIVMSMENEALFKTCMDKLSISINKVNSV